MLKRTISYITATCLLLTTSCGQLQMPPSVAAFSGQAASNSPPNLKAFLAARKVRPYYTGPLSIAIDPAIATKQGGFRIQGSSGGFRITAKSSGGEDGDKGLGNSSGTDADNPGQTNNGNHFGQQRRRVAWMIDHSSNDHHAKDTLGTYFDPKDLGSLGGLTLDPKAGEIQYGPVSKGAVSFGSDLESDEPKQVDSGYIGVEPTSEAALQQIIALTGAKQLGFA